MPTLRELMREYDASGYVYANRGPGSGFPEKGQFIHYSWEDVMPGTEGETNMYELPTPHISEDGVECHYASKWLTCIDPHGNSYYYRFYF